MVLEYPKVSNNSSVADVEQHKDIQAKVFDQSLHAEAKYKKVVDRHHLDYTLEKPMFQVGNRVWLL